MIQLLTFVAALGAFSAAARVPIQASSKEVSGKADRSPCGRRSLKEDEVYCNSIGYSDGYTPIENAHDVECDNGKREEKQCCEVFCSYYACRNNCTPPCTALTRSSAMNPGEAQTRAPRSTQPGCISTWKGIVKDSRGKCFQREVPGCP